MEGRFGRLTHLPLIVSDAAPRGGIGVSGAWPGLGRFSLLMLLLSQPYGFITGRT